MAVLVRLPRPPREASGGPFGAVRRYLPPMGAHLAGDGPRPDPVGPGMSAVPTIEGPRGWRSLRAPLVALVVLVLLLLRLGLPQPVVAVQPYAPRGLQVTSVPTAGWVALAVRASGFRPNTAVLVDVSGTPTRTVLADAAGVIDLRVPLPERAAVEVRGVASEGGGLELAQEVTLQRPGDRTRDVLLVLAGAVGAGLVGLLLRGRATWRARPGAVVPGPVDGPTSDGPGA